MRYVLLDRIETLRPPELAVGVKCISLSDDVFVDHFPGNPIMPGALLIEGMAQLAGILVESTMRERGRKNLHALLTMVDRAKFSQMVRPGDKLVFHAHGKHATEDGGRVHTVATRDEEQVAEAVLTFVFVEVNKPKLLARREEVRNVWLTGCSEGEP